MPAAIPAAAAVATTATASTLGTLATGAVLAGTAVQAVGMITKSKTLQKVGGITSMIGGLGMGANALMGGTAAATGASGAATGSSLFAKGANALNSAGQAATAGAATGGGIFAEGASKLNAAASVQDMGSIARVQDFLTRYDRTANILGGMGQGYAAYQTEKMRQEVPKERLDLDRDQWEQKQRNMGATSTIPNLRNLQSTGGGLLQQGVR